MPTPSQSDAAPAREPQRRRAPHPHAMAALPDVPEHRGRRLLLAVTTGVAAAAAAGNATVAAAHAFAPTWANDMNKLAPIVIAVVYTAVVASLLLVMGRTPAQRRSLLGLRPVSARSLLYGVAAWGGAYVVAATLYLASGAVGGSGVQDVVDLLMSVGADNGRLNGASVALATVILLRILLLSPLAEETLFRGALFGWLRTRLSATSTVLITGIAFGLIHQSPTFLPLAIVVGIAAGWIREHTGSVLVTVAAHALQSAIIVVLSLLLTGWDTPALLG